EDGIRDLIVTGVQTCALPISALLELARVFAARELEQRGRPRQLGAGSLARGVAMRDDRDGGEVGRSRTLRQDRGQRALPGGRLRSEERRVGKAWRSGWAREHA